MSIVVQCDHCNFNNGTDPTNGGHTLYDGRFNQSFTSPVVWEGNVCETCLADLGVWISAKVTR